jgi:hypothetical protein
MEEKIIHHRIKILGNKSEEISIFRKAFEGENCAALVQKRSKAACS